MRLERWFDRVVQLYPREFRELFADDMSGLFRRQCRGVLERSGRLGLFWFGAKTLISVLAAALYERLAARETRALPKRRGGPMTAIGHDLRYGARSLVKNPSFTLIAAGTLALGIGVNTTIFSLVNSLLFSELPITDPDTFGLVEAVSTESNDTESPATLADFALLKEDTNGYCQVGESPPQKSWGLEDAPSTISWGRIGLEALNLTIPWGGFQRTQEDWSGLELGRRRWPRTT